MSNYKQNLTFSGLGTITQVIPSTGTFAIDGKMTLPTIPAGEPATSNVAVVINKNGTPIYTGAAGARGFDVDAVCTASDTITIVLSSVSTSAQTATITIASPAVITVASTANNYVRQPVVFTTTGALPTGITSGTTYYISQVINGTTFKISATAGGSNINTSGSQSGVHTATFTTPSPDDNLNIIKTTIAISQKV